MSSVVNKCHNDQITTTPFLHQGLYKDYVILYRVYWILKELNNFKSNFLLVAGDLMNFPDNNFNLCTIKLIK